MPDISIQLAQTTDSTSVAAIRDHKVLVDRPEAKGGADKGPMGGELFLASIGGCFMSNLLAAVKARDVDASRLLVEVTGTLEGTPQRFSSVKLKVSGTYTDRKQMDKLVDIADKSCIMTNTLRDTLPLSFTLV